MFDKPALRVGLIGTGFMGKAHLFGLATACKVFDLPLRKVYRGDPQRDLSARFQWHHPSTPLGPAK